MAGCDPDPADPMHVEPAGEHPTRACCERVEQVELAARQLDRILVKRDLSCVAVDEQASLVEGQPMRPMIGTLEAVRGVRATSSPERSGSPGFKHDEIRIGSGGGSERALPQSATRTE